jgi:hypothetical protein
MHGPLEFIHIHAAEGLREMNVADTRVSFEDEISYARHISPLSLSITKPLR